MRQVWSLIVSPLVAAGLIAGTAFLQDQWLLRPGAVAADRLHVMGETLTHGGIPDTFGEWEGAESDEMSQAVEPAGVAGHACYLYKHRWTSRSASVYVVWGPARVMAGYTPAGWYPWCAFRQIVGPAPLNVVLGDSRAELSTSIFVKEDEATMHRLRVSWTSSDDGPWVASHLSLMKLGGSRPVVKVYMISDAPTAEGDEADPTIEFARGFLSAMTRVLAPSTPSL